MDRMTPDRKNLDPMPRSGSFLLPLLVAVCLLAQGAPAAAQGSDPGKHEFRKREDSLRWFAEGLVNKEDAADRLRSDSMFVRVLVRTLKLKNSFYYPLDSLETISHLYAPDSSFRIFTWQYRNDDFLFLQEGAIQMNQPDGSLKLYPLFDASMFTSRPLDSVRTRRNWIGAIYYRMVMKTFNGQKYYTLLGFDDYSISSNKKWMEVLTFSPGGDPVFGGPYFSFRDDTTRKPVQYRFSIEYKKEAATRFNYDPEMDMVLFDHLIPEDEQQPQTKDSYIPDGDFEGFKWDRGQWVHVDKIFNYKMKDGDFPQEQKILDEAGNPDEQKLMEQTEKNLKKAKPVKAPAPAPKKPGDQGPL
jgi:hypothetical protein